MAAAVTDHMPKNPANSKLKKDKNSNYQLEMIPCPDILSELSAQKIQIENGPVIEIYSIEKMISQGSVFTNEYINSKKNTALYGAVPNFFLPKNNYVGKFVVAFEIVELILVPNAVTIVVTATRTKPNKSAYSATVAASSSL